MGEKEALRKIKSELSKHIAVKKVCLFGSRAKGTFRKDSDYDVAVISDDFEGMSFFDRQALVRKAARRVLGDVSLDVVCYSVSEFKRGRRAFLPYIIEKEGMAV